MITDIVTDAGGATAGLAKFKELRTHSPIAIARRANTANQADDALAYLHANLEYYPKSSRTDATIATIKNAKGDKAGAIEAFEKAVALDPNNAPAKAQLETLKQ